MIVLKCRTDVIGNGASHLVSFILFFDVFVSSEVFSIFLDLRM